MHDHGRQQATGSCLQVYVLVCMYVLCVCMLFLVCLNVCMYVSSTNLRMYVSSTNLYWGHMFPCKTPCTKTPCNKTPCNTDQYTPIGLQGGVCTSEQSSAVDCMFFGEVEISIITYAQREVHGHLLLGHMVVQWETQGKRGETYTRGETQGKHYKMRPTHMLCTDCMTSTTIDPCAPPQNTPVAPALPAAAPCCHVELRNQQRAMW